MEVLNEFELKDDEEQYLAVHPSTSATTSIST